VLALVKGCWRGILADLHAPRGVTTGGGTIPRAPNRYGDAESPWGALNDCEGAKMSRQCHRYFFQYSVFGSERSQVRTRGRQTCFLPRAPSNLVTSLHAPTPFAKIGQGYLRRDLSEGILLHLR